MGKIRRAAKEYRCTEQSYHLIRPGDLYWFAAMPPWHEMNQSGKWWSIKACLRCADEFGLHCSDTRAQLKALQTPTDEAASNQPDLPTCPWCGFLIRDAWKLADVQDMECPDCGEPIRVERIVSEDYRTTRITR